MNERIRLLALEAGLRFTQLMSNPMVPVVDGKETDLEKFAQLMVQECIEEVMNYRVHNNPTREIVPFIVQDIKLHFGVEE